MSSSCSGVALMTCRRRRSPTMIALPVGRPTVRRAAPELLPRRECLKDLVERLLPYCYDATVGDLAVGKTVLIAAHRFTTSPGWPLVATRSPPCLSGREGVRPLARRSASPSASETATRAGPPRRRDDRSEPSRAQHAHHKVHGSEAFGSRRSCVRCSRTRSWVNERHNDDLPLRAGVFAPPLGVPDGCKIACPGVRLRLHHRSGVGAQG